MDNFKTDQYYIDKLVTDFRYIEKHMNGVTPDEFNTNEILQDAMMFRLIQISENARKLSEEYKQQKTNIPWTEIYGLRNKIVHEYGHVDLTIVFDTLTSDIPELLNILV